LTGHVEEAEGPKARGQHGRGAAAEEVRRRSEELRRRVQR
jgi:hypothetical protein